MKEVLRELFVRSRGALLARVEPYLFVEVHSERRFWKYLQAKPNAVRNVVIVGAWQGTEIPGLLGQYPGCTIAAFEPSPKQFRVLAAAYAGNPRVKCFQEALSDFTGEAEFHEGSLPGSGSLLPFGQDDASARHNLGLFDTGSFRVRVSTLDEHEATRELDLVDLLKIDVQGAEAAVIEGGRKLIARTSAVLVEVALRGSAYSGSARFTALTPELASCGLALCALGVDPVTLDGNALFIRVGTEH